MQATNPYPTSSLSPPSPPLTERAMLGTAFVLVSLVSPLISLVALPILAVKTAKDYAEHKSLYKKTLTNQTRAPFGRVEGQDYTRWDGKEIKVLSDDQMKKKLHKELRYFSHGCVENGITRKQRYEHDASPADCPFKTKEDLEWLKIELARVKKEKDFKWDKDYLCLFSEMLIPLVGVFLAYRTFRTLNNISKSAGEWKWEQVQAINYHIEALQLKLDAKNPV